MATQYLDYVIKYGGVVKSTNTDTGLTSIDIKYGGTTKATITTATTKTLPTSGKYCNNNITIGARTCAVSGKYCASNITVETTARYRWNKYNTKPLYTMTSTRIAATSTAKYFGSTANARYCFGHLAGYTFYNDSGEYELYGGTPTWVDFYPSNKVVASNEWFSEQQTVTTNYRFAKVGAAVSARGSYLNGLGSIVNNSLNDGGTAYGSASAGTQKGDTHYGVVNSTNAGAYPANGEQDGYWYVAI